MGTLGLPQATVQQQSPHAMWDPNAMMTAMGGGIGQILNNQAATAPAPPPAKKAKTVKGKDYDYFHLAAIQGWSNVKTMNLASYIWVSWGMTSDKNQNRRDLTFNYRRYSLPGR